ncbi:MAG: hypothetical protein KAT15_24975, partial [Bacteroidales bacterium]|nr:hypothetical protein [Bacteroidales bacterium]
MNIKKLVLMAFLASLMNLYSQDSKSFKRVFLDAEYYFITENYDTALSIYEDLLIMDPDNSNLRDLSGYCCLKIGSNQSKAFNYLEEALLDVDPSYKEGSYRERHAPPEVYFLLARAYHIQNAFKKAIDLYERFRDLSLSQKFADIEFVNAQIKSCELGMSMINDPIKVKF